MTTKFRLITDDDGTVLEFPDEGMRITVTDLANSLREIAAAVRMCHEAEVRDLELELHLVALHLRVCEEFITSDADGTTPVLAAKLEKMLNRPHADCAEELNRRTILCEPCGKDSTE